MGLYDDACEHKGTPSCKLKLRKVTRLVREEVDFLELKEGDLFVLEDPPPMEERVEDGTTINVAESDAVEAADGAHRIECSPVGKTAKLDPPVHPEALAWMEDCRQQMKNVEYFKGDRNALIRLVLNAPSLVELVLGLKEKGYHKLVEDDAPPERMSTGPTCAERLADDWSAPTGPYGGTGE